MGRARATQVHRVSGVREGRSVDVGRRYRRYAISMSIRTLCFVLAVLAHGPLRWVLLAVSLVLPYVAVVVANGGRQAQSATMAPVILPSRTQLRSGTVD